MNKEELLIIKKASLGHKDSLIRLIKKIQPNIKQTLYYLKKDYSDINDITQDILIKVINKISLIKNPLSFKIWLNQIIVNSYYDYLRKTRKNSCNIVALDENYNSIPSEKINPQYDLLKGELGLIIRNSIDKLPAQYKIPITLREIQGLSYEEISNITKTTLGTVKSRISRARNKIKKQIEQYNNS